MEQTSELKVSKDFTKHNVGRFACNSLFGGATVEMESQALASMPTELHVLSVNSNSVKLAWKHPGSVSQRRRNAEHQVDGYVVEYRTADDRTWRELTGGALRTEDRIVVSYSVSDLAPNHKYQFRVRARTSNGLVSVPSSSSNWVSTPPSAPTGVVTNLRWRVLDDTHLLIQWDPIEEDPSVGPNFRYNVSWSTTPRDTFDKWEIVSEPHVIIHSLNQTAAGGDGCKMMAVAVSPVNDVGAGETSTDVIVHFSDHGPKRHAKILEIKPINSSHMELSWTWADANECENVVGAKVRCVETLGKEFQTLYVTHNQSTPFPTVTQSIPPFYTKWVVKGLQPWTDYMCSITPFDQYGREGRRSPSAFGTTFGPAPLEPPSIRKVKLQETESGTFTTRLEWDAVNLITSENSSESERGYKIEVYVSETAEKPVVLTILEAELQSPYRPSAKIDGLKLMYFYTIRV
ncbi:Protein RIG-6 c [Aphelenchoides avenae]|nr:Protein RIG-6 c [Aphelenchus avenae]